MYDQEYLAHHGIKGMKWGVRRYVNEDGTLTPKGRKRYGSQDNYEVMQLRKKGTKHLTNAELEKIAKRTQLEKSIRRGDEATKRALIDNGTRLLATGAVIAAATIGGKYLVKNMPRYAETLGTAIGKSSVNIVKGAGSEIGKGAAEGAKAAATAAAKAGHDIRKNVARSNGARAYVKAVDSILGVDKGRRHK